MAGRTSTHPPDALGAAFARRRRQLALSQQALADRTGLLQKTISAIETGAGDPQRSSLRILAEALGCELRLVRPRETANRANEAE
ncbi:MAG: helix-turn-helix transcriptional regulator [Planctomycetes bacterium]|nr:helix-turn-helix transcriptional regulator [Planctomycetota bacterium]